MLAKLVGLLMNLKKATARQAESFLLGLPDKAVYRGVVWVSHQGRSSDKNQSIGKYRDGQKRGFEDPATP
ncbi:MAG: hypothetical protein KGJ80_09825 [Chloroflexota bacterium]|nr:hypothetical protein [Chloroflexota bacterium]